MKAKETIVKRSTVETALVLTITFTVPAKAQTSARSLTDHVQTASGFGSSKTSSDQSWMSGYFSATKNLDVLDFRYVERNRKVVGNYCKTHKSDTVMSAMQKNWR